MTSTNEENPPITDAENPGLKVKEPGPFALAVDPQQQYKAKELKICSFARPHMRAFHYSWWSFFIAFFIWFSAAPLLPEIRDTLEISPKQVWLSNILAVSGDVVMRFVFGSLTDKFGSRILMGGVLMVASIPTACTGLVNSLGGLCILRLCIGCAGSSFVMCQCWATRMFTKEIVGTANALVGGWGNVGGGVTQIVMGTALFPLFRDVVYADAEDPSESAWRIVCVIPAIVAFSTGVLVIMTSEDCPEGNYKQLIKEGRMQAVSASASLRQGAVNFNTWLLYIQYGCCFGVELTMNNAAASYFVDEFDLDTSTAAAIASIFGFMNIFARGLGGYFSDRANEKIGMKGRIWVQLILLLLEGICILIFAVMDTLWAAILVLTIFSIFVQGAEGSTYGIVPYVNPAAPGAVAGIVGAGGPSGAIAFGMGFLFLVDTQHAYFLMGGLVILSAISCLLLNIKGHGGIFLKPKNGVPGQSLTVPTANKDDAKKIEEDESDDDPKKIVQAASAEVHA
jgi:NNP family nitrate/nitrite transporter-like MFS transporter